MLTGKTKEKFEGWLLFKSHNISRVEFGLLPLVCQQALVVEFFRFMLYDVFVLPYATVQYLGEDWVGLDQTHSFFIYERGKHLEDGTDFSSSEEALSKAIEKADELFNLNNE